MKKCDFLDKTVCKDYNSFNRPAVKTRKPAVKSSVYVQFGGKEIVEKDVVAACKKAYADLETGEELKTLEIYIKLEEGAAYYVANGVASNEYKVVL